MTPVPFCLLRDAPIVIVILFRVSLQNISGGHDAQITEETATFKVEVMPFGPAAQIGACNGGYMEMIYLRVKLIGPGMKPRSIFRIIFPYKVCMLHFVLFIGK